MKKLILIPITLTALAPAISLVGCGDPDTPEPEYKEVEMKNQVSFGYVSDTQTFYKDKKYKCSVDEIGPDPNLDFSFMDNNLDEVWVDATLEKIEVRGCELQEYTWIHDENNWKLSFKMSASGSVCVYLKFNKDISNVMACIGG